MGSFVVGLDSTVVNVALPAIEEDLGGGLAGQQWISNGYLLALASLILVGGSLGDVFGERRVFSIGLVGFGATSMVCALAPTIEVHGRRARRAGRLRRAADAERARGDRRRLPARAARRRGRLVAGVVGHRDGDRAARRRPADRRGVVALDLRDQRAVRRGDAGPRLHRGAAAPAGRRPAAGRLAGRGAVVPRPRRADARADPPARLRLERAGRVPARPRRPRVLRPVPRARGHDRVPDAAAGPVQAAQLRGGQHRDVRDVRRAGGDVLLPRPVPPAGRGLLRAGGRARDAADHARDVRALQARGRARRPLRAAGVHGRRAAGGRGRAAADAARRRGRRLRGASCCRPCSCSRSVSRRRSRR